MHKEKNLMWIFVFLLVFSSSVSAWNFEGDNVKIIGPFDSNGGIPVNVRDKTSQPVDLFFIQALYFGNLSVQAVKDNNIITVSPGFNSSDGNQIGLFGAGEFYFGTQVTRVGDNITLDTPLNTNFSAGTQVLSANNNMVIDGSVNTQIFRMGAGAGITLDITGIMCFMQSTASMGDGTFGSIPGGLDYGVVLRKVEADGTIVNIWNVKTNGDFGLLAYDTTYIDRIAGVFGFRVRNTYAGQEKHGVVLRLESFERLEMLIQDDITSDAKMEIFICMAQGNGAEDV